MSKVSEVKKRMGYNPKQLASCRNCKNMLSVRSAPYPKYPNYKTEKLTCNAKIALLICGGFAVKAQAICNEFKRQD